MIVTIIWNDIVIMATVGDSRSFIASKMGNDVTCKLTTTDQKPEDPNEKVRIEEAGGKVEALKDDEGRDFGPCRVWNKEMTAPGLAMSRSIGDSYAHTFGVSCLPEIVKGKISPEDRFIFMGSDGIYEF